MYENRSTVPLSFPLFLRRVVLHACAAMTLVLVSLGAGVIGYEQFEHLPWRDAFLNSAMLLGGMGPVDPPRSDGGKLFAGLYALYSGLIFLVAVAIMFAPVLHRLMHKFHWRADR